MSSLPTEIITDILSRQPIKSLLRFRCVSKPWCSLIDGQYFIKLHLERSTHTHSHTNLILKHTKLYSLNLDSLNVIKLDDHPLDSPYFDTELLGSCNGLVCLGNTDNVVAIWNPSTRNHHILPAYPIRLLSFEFVIYGFGYDCTNDDYKVLGIVQRFGNNVNGDVPFKTQVVVYSLKLNSWRMIDDFPYDLLYMRASGVFVSGALHYAGISKSNPDVTLIIAFDLDVEKYRLVPHPEQVEDITHTFVGVLGGCLCIIYIRPESANIWVMKEYGVKESWVKLICISPGVIACYSAHVRPLAYSKNGDAILLERDLPDGVKLIWYDLQNKTFENAKFQGVPKSFEALFFVGSLVPLKGGIGRKKQLEAEVGKNGKKRDDFLSVGFKLVL